MDIYTYIWHTYKVMLYLADYFCIVNYVWTPIAAYFSSCMRMSNEEYLKQFKNAFWISLHYEIQLNNANTVHHCDDNIIIVVKINYWTVFLNFQISEPYVSLDELIFELINPHFISDLVPRFFFFFFWGGGLFWFLD